MDRTFVHVIRDELGDQVDGIYGYVDGYVLTEAGYILGIVVETDGRTIKTFPLNRLEVVSKFTALRGGA